MKNRFLKTALSFAVVAVCSCNQKNNVENESPEVQNVEKTIIESKTDEGTTKTIEGKVVEIKNGKDGYTAKIETTEKEFYFVTISHSNLKDAGQYKSVQIGENLKVTGDFWKMEDDNQITVRSID